MLGDDSHDVQFTPLKYAIPWFLMYLQSCATITPPKKKNPHLLVVTLYMTPLPQPSAVVLSTTVYLPNLAIS